MAVVKENNTYQIAHVTSDSQIPSYEEMISGAIKLVSAGKKITTAQSSIAEPNIKPKRLLHLHELPTSLPKKSDPLSKGANPLKCVLPAVGYVEIEEQDGQESSGSGFVITPDGKFVTSYHVIENARSIRVRFDDRPHEWFSAELLDGDKEADIAVLKLEGNNFSYALIVTYGDKVELGENVGLLGYPLGEELGSRITYTAGVISSFRRQTGGTLLYQIDANAYHGNSGGPLVRLRDGRIIGILMGGWKEAVQMNFAVSTNEIYKRLVTEY
ncbi:MAG: putative serine protease HtrA [Firmicutes bacterium]|nr:putative serine protease HtrA [Bacillota bacterium]